MNILFVSKLSGSKWIGPNYSVPAQVAAQSELDNCLWYNLHEHSFEQAGSAVCLSLSDVSSGSLDDLPTPFDRPDIAIIEGLYSYPFERMVRQMMRRSIPYIIVPRSSMTDAGQSFRSMKKRMGNLVWFDRMVRSAAAIQFLTERERDESRHFSYKKDLVIPNGTTMHDEEWVGSGALGMRGSYIGRIEGNQKGLDILIEAVALVQQELRDADWHVTLHGPDRLDSLDGLMRLVSERSVGDLVEFSGPVYGDEKGEVLIHSDFFVMTSRFEGLPMGMIEALAYGVPCLATEGTNLADVIQDAGAGWTCETSVAGVAGSLLRMLADLRQLTEMSVAAKQLSRRYSWDEIAKISHDEYSRIGG